MVLVVLFCMFLKLFQYVTNNNKSDGIKYEQPTKMGNDIRRDWNNIIKDNSNIKWHIKYGENTKHNGKTLITMDDANNFVSNKSMYYVSKVNNEYAMNDRMLFCDKCIIQINRITQSKIAKLVN